MLILVLIFGRTYILFSIVAVPIYIPTNSVQGSPLLCILVKLVPFRSFVFLMKLFNSYEVIGYYGLHLSFSFY